MDGRSTPRTQHNSSHDATHQPWSYTSNAVVWSSNGTPLEPNIQPFANQMCAWLKQESDRFWPHHVDSAAMLGKQGNPFTASLVTIAASISFAINDSFAFIESKEKIHPVEAEVRRIRLECELVLYSARFCEAVIKQMLYCTNFPKKLYRNASMGHLLSQDCLACRRSNLPTHSFSLLGSLAHQYFLCHEIDQCALDHLIIANKRRNLEAAHSDAQELNAADPALSKTVLKQRLGEVVEAFAHLLGHIANIESSMIKEINIRMRFYPEMPPRSAYDFFLTRTASDYDQEGVYRGPAHGVERTRSLAKHHLGNS